MSRISCPTCTCAWNNHNRKHILSSIKVHFGIICNFACKPKILIHNYGHMWKIITNTWFMLFWNIQISYSIINILIYKKITLKKHGVFILFFGTPTMWTSKLHHITHNEQANLLVVFSIKWFFNIMKRDSFIWLLCNLIR